MVGNGDKGSLSDMCKIEVADRIMRAQLEWCNELIDIKFYIIYTYLKRNAKSNKYFLEKDFWKAFFLYFL